MEWSTVPDGRFPLSWGLCCSCCAARQQTPIENANSIRNARFNLPPFGSIEQRGELNSTEAAKECARDRFSNESRSITSVQVRIAEVVERRVEHGRDSDMWLGGLILKRANSPPRIAARRGGGVTKKKARSLLMHAAGVVFLVSASGTPPRPRDKRMLRDTVLIDRPPLLVAMRGEVS